MILTAAQDRALMEIRAWARDPSSPMFVLGGFAGTGKSTILDYLVEDFPGVRFCGPTGKSVSVMRSKLKPGTLVTTIHSYLYSPRDVTEKELDDALGYIAELKRIGASRSEILDAQNRHRDIREMLERGQCRFIDRESVERCNFIVVDEASMVNEKTRDDLLDAGTKVLFVGDPGQLPPIQGREFFEDNPPNVMLQEVHRQAAGSRILRLATAVRNGEKFSDWGGDCERLEAFPGMEAALEADQVIAGMNRTRMGFNRAARKFQGHGSVYPENGEPVVCLRNDHIMGFINGVGGYALSDAQEDSFGDLTMDVAHDGHIVRGVFLDPYPFACYERPLTRRDMPANGGSIFDFGHALTVHKAQGSEWDHVMVIDDKMRVQDREFRKRWIYTAATRARSRLTWINRRA